MKIFLCTMFAFATLQGWGPSVDLIGKFGNYEKGGGAVLFSPVLQDDDSILFAQAGGGYFQDVGSASIGGGYRQVVYRWLALGVNGFFDFGRSEHRRNYYQGGIGIEAFGNCWLIRANGYFPSRNLQIRSQTVGQVTTVTREQGYMGSDLEGGVGLHIGPGQVWGYAAYYRFDRTDARSIQGPRFRMEYTLDQNWELTLGGQYEWNWRHGHTGSGYLAFRLPFGQKGARSSSCCDSLCRQMGNRVYRHPNIWVDREIDTIFGSGAGFLARLFFIENGVPDGGAGTQVDPMNIDEGFTNANQVNDVLFFLADGGDLQVSEINGGAGGSLVLPDNHQAVGFGGNPSTTITFENGDTLLVTALGAGVRPIIVGDGANPLFVSTGTSDMVIQGLEMENGTATEFINMVAGGSLRVTDVTNVTDIADLLLATNIGDILIEDSTLETGALNWTQTSGMPTLTISNSSITSASEELFGWTISGPGTEATILFNLGSTLVEGGIGASTVSQTSATINFTINDITSDVAYDWDVFGTGNVGTWLIEDSTFTDPAQFEIETAFGAPLTGDFRFFNNTLTSSAIQPIDLIWRDGSTGVAVIDGSTITGGDSSIRVVGEGVINVQITDCDLDPVGDAGVGVIEIAKSYSVPGTLFFDIDGNRIGQVTRSDGEAINVVAMGPGAPVHVEGFVRNNICRCAASGGSGGVLMASTLAGAADIFTVAVQSNTIDADTIPSTTFFGAGTANVLNYTLTGNTATTAAVPANAFSVGFLADHTGVDPCATITGNTSPATGASGISVLAPGLVSTSLDLTFGTPAGLDAANPGVVTTPATIVGPVVDIGATTCPLPVVPPIP